MNLKKIKEVSLLHKRRKRIGRGPGSGMGKTSTRGQKGARARAGFHGLNSHEGGQTPLFRRLPKRGFSNFKYHLKFAVVNVGDLNDFPAGSEVTPEVLVKAKMVRKIEDGIKILGNGALDVPLKVQAHRFSKSALEKIREAGGEVKQL